MGAILQALDNQYFVNVYPCKHTEIMTIMHDLKTMKKIGEIQDSIIYDVNDQPVDVRESRADGWDTCSRPVICIFDGQFDITGLGNITAWHHSWGITVVPVDNTTVWDVLKDNVAVGNQPGDNAGIDAKCLELLNHGTLCPGCEENPGTCPGLCDDPPELEPEPETATENPFVEVEMVNINNTLANTAARFTSAAQYCKHVIRYDDYDGAACGQESEEWDIVPCSFENCPRINA